MRARFAFKNLIRARGHLLISMLGIAFAAFLMAIQGSLLYGFTLAASRIVDAIDADIVMVAPGIPTFEYVAPIEERLVYLARGVPGVASTGRGYAGWASFQKVSGDRTLVFCVGIDRDFRGRAPDMPGETVALGGFVTPVVTDLSDRHITGAGAEPVRVSIGGRRADLVQETKGFASFLGSPFVFGDLEDIRRFLRYDRTALSFVTVRAEPGADPIAVRDALRERFPNVDVLTRHELSSRSRSYWLMQTGAGGALMLAALLGFLIGVSVVAQTIYSLTVASVDEYATLKAMGASNRYVMSIVLLQSLLCGALGAAIGLALVGPFAVLGRNIVAWLTVPGWMYGLVVVAVALLCTLAALIAARPALSAEPARVFRA
jgi:putative ABC transport system permease protein